MKDVCVRCYFSLGGDFLSILKMAGFFLLILQTLLAESVM